jgi:hypothetical protein
MTRIDELRSYEHRVGSWQRAPTEDSSYRALGMQRRACDSFVIGHGDVGDGHAKQACK